MATDSNCLHFPYVLDQSSPFAKSSLKLLDVLGIRYDRGLESSFVHCAGYFDRILDVKRCVASNFMNIARAIKNNGILLALEEDSYAGLMYSISVLDSNTDALCELKTEFSRLLDLDPEDLDLCNVRSHVAYLPQIVADTCDRIPSLIKYRFDGSNVFSACVYYGGRHYDVSVAGGYTGVERVYNAIGLKVYDTHFSFQCYAHLVDVLPSLAYSQSARIMFSGIDLGVDFLLSYSHSQFLMFDKKHSLCVSHYSRDPIYVCTLTLYELLLISFGITNDIGLDLHSNVPDFLSA